MKLYKDQEMKEEIDSIDFGIVEAGQTKTITIYLFNNTKAVISNLNFDFGEVPIKDLEIVHAPKTIQPGKSDRLILKWSPSLNFKQALEVPIFISGEEIYLIEQHSKI